MSVFHRLISGVRALFRKGSDLAELDEELQSYLQQSAEDKIAQGMEFEVAHRTVRVEMGSVAAVKDHVLDAGWESVVDSFLRDLRYGFRMLRKNPVVTLVCLVTLGLAIGVNAVIFSVVNWLVLRPLPVRDPGQLTFLAFPRGAQNFDERFSWAELQELASSSSTAFSGTAGLMFGGVSGGSVRDGLTVDGHTEKIEPVFVSGSFFNFLGLQAYRGRLLLPGEGQAPGADPVVVLSYRYWQQRFNGDTAIVDKKAFLDGIPVTIVGISPKDFFGLTPITEMQAYVPLGMAASMGPGGREFFSNPQGRAAMFLARLRPGITPQHAQTLLAAAGLNLQKEFPRPHEGKNLLVLPLRPPGIINGPNPLHAVAALFLTLSGIVLLLAAVNITSLLLARGAVRRPEMAVRAALGASRNRLLCQMITESVLLALLGCIVGIGVGFLGCLALRSIPLRTQEAFNLDFRFDWRVFTYLTVLSLVTGVAVGVMPALRILRGNLNQALHFSERATTAARQKIRSGLVVLQVSAALALIVTAGLFLRSLMSVQHATLGFDPAHVLNLSFDPHEIGYEKTRAESFYATLLRRVQSLPGVQSASFAAAVPLGDTPYQTEILIEGRQPETKQDTMTASFNMVTPDYLTTMGMTLLRGRNLAESDTRGSTDVALITPAMAHRYWPGKDPVGAVFATIDEPKRPLRIVGVVNDSRYSQVYDPFEPLYFVPLAQHFTLAQTLQIRTTGEPQQIAADVHGVVSALDPSMPVYDVTTMTSALRTFNGLLMFEIAAGLAAVLGGVGLLLSIVGVYGVLSFSVVQRTREIGIRLALGATPGTVVRMVVWQGVSVITAGLVVGLLLAFLVGGLVSDFLVGVSARDPLTYIAVTLLLATVALIAVFVPAIRATRINPVAALRME